MYDLIKISDESTKSIRNIYPAFDLFKRMTHKFDNRAPLDIHDFDNLAIIFCFDLTAIEELF